MIGGGLEEALDQFPVDEAIINSKNMELRGLESDAHGFETKVEDGDRGMEDDEKTGEMEEFKYLWMERRDDWESIGEENLTVGKGDPTDLIRNREDLQG